MFMIMAHAWEYGPNKFKLQFMAIAEHADNHGQCYPSMKRIAEVACCSKETAKRAVRWLTVNGWIYTTHRTTSNGKQTSNMYQINLERINALPRKKTNDKQGGQNDPIGGSKRPRLEGGQNDPDNRTTNITRDDALVYLNKAGPYALDLISRNETVTISGRAFVKGTEAHRVLTGEFLRKRGLQC